MWSMVVILTHAQDAAALWLHAALSTLAIDDVELVAVEQLVYSRRIIHRLDRTGDRGAIHLADGRVMRAEAITGLINRVQYLPTQHFATAEASDRAYATQELSAFMLAWLDSIAGRVINPAVPFALDGGAFQPETVVHLAAAAGLPTTTWRVGTNGPESGATPTLPVSHTAIVLDGRLFGAPLASHLQDGCRQLAALLGVPLLQVLLHRSDQNEWRFVGASGATDFRIGGRPFAAAIARALSAGNSTE